MTRARPILDFDGVLCDGMLECLLVSFCVWQRLDVAQFSTDTLCAIPKRARRSFQHCRGFSRHIGHFALAFTPALAAVATEADFDALYAQCSRDQVEDFVARLVAFRDQVRERTPERWFELQPLFAGIKQVLIALDGDFQIVSAKDAATIRAVLEHHGLEVNPEHISGGHHSKLAAFEVCRARQQRPRSEIVVIDDNVHNVLEARRAGYDARWASWGYHAPQHCDWARRHNLPALSLRDFTRLWTVDRARMRN